ncbi:MAG: hypothetical protein ACEY3G_04910 [Arsenophonus sp.]
MTQFLGEKLAKNENGGRHPRQESFFLKNLDLLETVNLAKNVAPTSPKINDKILTKDVQLTATDVHAVASEVLRIEIHVGVLLPLPTEIVPRRLVYLQRKPFDKKKYQLLHSSIPQANALIFVVNLFVV